MPLRVKFNLIHSIWTIPQTSGRITLTLKIIGA